MKFTLAAFSAIVIGTLAVNAAPAPEKRANNGMATWYRQNGNAGSCGQFHSDDDHVVALRSGSHCGDRVTIQHNGKTTHATVADTCPTCGDGQIDLSRGAFGALADYSQGEIDITWWFD
jgi:rare lipoprotein A (peptidoglycan hydrolase)